MTKKELIGQVSDKLELTKKDVELYVNAILDTITETLEKGEEVSIVGFGKFEVKERAQRNGINPQTKELIVIEASKTVKFKPAKNLKEIVNK